MSRAGAALAVAVSLAVLGLSLRPLFAAAPAPAEVEAPPEAAWASEDLARIDAVLVARAPGWGLNLRRQVAQAIEEESAAAGLDPMLVLAVISVESEFQEDVTSVVGARGLMQLRPATLHFMAAREGLKLSAAEVEADPALNVRLGVRYLKAMQARFGGNLDLALMAYNAGPGRLSAGLKARNTERWRGYVRAVRRDFARLKRSLGQSGDWALAQR